MGPHYPTNGCVSSGGKDKQLPPSPTSALPSPRRINLESCQGSGWTRSLRKAVTAQRCSINQTPKTQHIRISSALGPPEHKSLTAPKNPSYNLVFFLSMLSVQLLLHFPPESGSRQRISLQGHLVLPKALREPLFDGVSLCNQVNFSSRVYLVRW